ncbi:MAG: phage tail tape measure protein [Peptoniphilus lacydonensis]|uniref:phage tail tape measure protein n=1 Tax=Peptoniphilus lacydonensis TaxID=1673725 RepID=UPI00258834DB|nr:phage tail tape measure protein [Peptoniphilus lacydonensis]MDU7302129.1 phage tail tape measure protein [Peptoniphilus lacydonensis]
MSDYNVTAILTANAKGLIAGMKEAQASVQEFGKSTTSIGASVPGMLNGIGKGLTAALTVPITAGFAASVKASSDFESALTGVAKTTNLSGKELEAMGTAIKNMAREVPASTTEIAAVAEAAGQLGISKENIMGFTRTMIDMGEATNLTAEEAATAFARFANITQMPQTEMSNLGSTVVALGNNFATTEKEIVDMGLRLAATGTQIGLNQAEVMGLATAMSSVGISAEAGGSAMSTVMQKINTAVLSSSDKVQGFAKVAGMSASEFSTAWREQPTVAIEAFIQGLKKIQDSGGDVNGALKELGINGLREVDTLARLAGAGDMVSQAFDMANESFSQNTALSDEAAQRYGTFASQVKTLWNSIKEVGVVIGDMLLPYVQKAVDVIGNLVKGFLELDPSAQKAIVVIAGIAAAIGPLLITLSKIPKTIENIQTGFGLLSKGLGLLGGGFTKLGGLAKAAFGIIAAHPFVALGAAAAVGVGLIIANWDKIGPIVAQVWEGIKTKAAETWAAITEGVTAFIEGFKAAWEAIPEFFSNLWTGISEGMVTAFDGVKETIVTVWDGIKTAVVEKVTGIKDGIMQALEPISGNIENIWNGIKTVTQAAWDIIKNVVIGAGLVILQTITGDFKGAVDSAKQIWDNLKQATQTAWEAIKDIIKNSIEAASTVVSTVTAKIKEAITTAWNNVKETTTSVWNSIKEAIKSAWDNIKESVKSSIENVKTTIKNGFDQAKQNISTAVENIKKTVSEGFKNVLTTIKNTLRELPGTIKTAFSQAINAAKSFISQAVQVGRDLINGFITGIKEMASNLANAAKSVVGNAISAAKSALKIHSPSRVFKDIGFYTVKGFAVGLTDNAKMAANAMNKVIDPLTGTSVDIGSNLADINGQAKNAIDYTITDKLGGQKQSQTLILRLGNKDFKAFIEDITDLQGQEIKLQEVYGI